MEAISLKLEGGILLEIDQKLKEHRYSTRTEFIRDAIREKLSDLEKEEIIKKLIKLKGSLKRKSKMSEKKAGELAIKSVAKKLGINLD